MNLKARLAQLETQARGRAQGGDEDLSPIKALVQELPDLLLRVLAGEEVDLKAEIDALMDSDPDEARLVLTSIRDLVGDPELLEETMGIRFDG